MRSLLLSSLVVAAGLLPVVASAQIAWTGATDNDWATGANWLGGDAPGAADTAQFDSDPTNVSPNFATDTAVAAITFLSGAGSYEFSGSALTLGSGTVITNSSGALQTFSNQIIFGAASATLDVSAGSELTFASTIGKTTGINTGGLTVSGGGVVNLTGAFTNYTTFQFLTATGGSTINYNTSTQNGANIYQASGGRINLHRAPGASGNVLQLRGTGGEIYLSQADLSVSTQSGLRFRGDEANGKTLTFGADFAGPGSAVFGSTVHLNHTGAGSNQTYRLSAAADNVLILAGVVQDTNASGTGTKVEIVGPGTVRLFGSASNTSVTPVLISSGVLELAKSDGAVAIAGGGVTIDADGTLRLAASHQIADATTLTFDGGLFDAGGFTESLGALAVGAEGGTIDFGGEGGALTFASLSSIVGTLEVTGWNNAASITFLDWSGWDAAALEKVSFDGAWSFDEETGTFSAAAIPEPSAAAALMGAAVLGLAVLRNRRRR